MQVNEISLTPHLHP